MERLKQRKDWIEEKRGREVEWEWRGNGVKRGSTRGEMGKNAQGGQTGHGMEVWKVEGRANFKWTIQRQGKSSISNDNTDIL